MALGRSAGRQRHQHLVVEHAAVAALGVAGDRQARLAGGQRAAPGIGAGGFTDHAPVELGVAGPLQAVDEQDHLPGRGVDQADVGWVQAPAGQWRHRHRAVSAMRHHVHGALVCGRILDGGEPHAGHGLAGQPLFVLRMQADDGTALRTDQVFARDAEREAQACGLRDDLVCRVDGLGPAQLGHGQHVLDALEQLHADGRGLQTQQAVQLVDERGPVGGARCGLGHG